MFKYKPSRFYAQSVRTFTPSETEKKEARASLEGLKSKVAPFMDSALEPDLLYIMADLAVGGMVNRNDDALDIEKALEVYKNFEKKPCDIEHNRKYLIGYIMKSFLTDRETGERIGEDDARLAGKPFNITTVAVIWRVVADELCNYIIDSFNNKKDELSLSFEVGFDGYYIIGLPKDTCVVKDAAFVINDNNAAFPLYDAALRCNGGSGVKDGYSLARVLNTGVIPLGQGVVADPAAQVKGILPMTQEILSKISAEVSDPVPVNQPTAPVDTHIDINPTAAETALPSVMQDVQIVNLAFKEQHKGEIESINDSLSKLYSIYEKIVNTK